MTGPTMADEMEPLDHPELASAAAYALDALDDAERPVFEEHLAACPRCRAEVAELRGTVVALAQAAPPASPPPALRDRVLRDARDARAAATREASSSAVVPLASRRPRSPLVPWLAAAAGLVLAASLGWALARERAERRALRAALASAESRADRAAALAAQRDSLLEVVLSPVTSSAKLAATGQPPSMQLVWHRGARVIVLSASDLAPARSGRIYQLWGLDAAGQPRSLGTFNTRGDGRGYVVLPAPADMDAVRASAVTEEPAGGSPAPTSQPFLVGRWG